jgi:hypothetical protein
MELAAFAASQYVLGVSDRRRPVEALSKGAFDDHPGGGMMATSPHVDVLL